CDRIRFAVSEIPAGQWIRGRGWEAAHRVEGGFPDRAEIDHLTPNHPVALSSKDGHSIWLNSRALAELSIDQSIPDPPGGRYDRRTDGSLTGIALENAADAIIHQLPPLPDSEKRRLVSNALPRLHSQGIIAVHSFEGLDEFNLFLEMEARNELPLRVTASFNREDFERALAGKMKPGAAGRRIRLGGLKLYADGALGSRSAAMFAPYTGEPENYGIVVTESTELIRDAVRAAEHGFPTAIHAIGDKAVRHALDALEAARAVAPDLPGMRIEHVQMVQPRDLLRFQAVGIAASIQPCHMLSDIDMAERYWSEQTGMRYPYGSLAASGAICVMGSDAPIDDEHPMRNIRGAVTRRRLSGPWAERAWIPEECMEIIDALRGYTSFPAMLEGSHRGVLVPGYPADVVVLSGNPLVTKPEHLHGVDVETVYLDGERIFPVV
ncbi:MAG TPA: amidohydrolase, partial [bacterium]|nr:amidohydrolase [bacterium]